MDVDGGGIGAGTIINTCTGTISEGVGDYANNDAFQITICAPAGQAIQLTFGQWDIEGCCDYVTVYDNGTNSGTQLYYGDGADPNPGVITSTGSCITITWDSDGSVINGGWDATISCYTPGTCSDGVQNQNETGVDCGGTYCYPCTCYNGVQDAGEDGVDCGTVCGVACPCEITVNPSPAALPCGGGTVSIEATAQGSTSFALNNDFQVGAGNGWSVSPAGQFDNPCDPSVDGGTYMWMGNTTAAPRTLETTPLDVECGGDICFFLDFATQGGALPCEGPDLPNEGVFLEYSINNGATWVTINYFDPGNGTAGPYLAWDQYCFPIPAAAETQATMFHWFQNGSSGTCCDHWGIDNVTITSQSCNPYVYDWTQVPAGSTFPNDSAVTSTITTTTDFTVCYTNNVDDTCCTTITIAVGSLDPLVVTGTDEICAGATDGTITIDPATGGTAPYTYDIAGPTNLSQVSNGSFTGLPSGNYTITVTDNAGCTATIGPFTINEPTPIIADLISEADQCLSGNSFSFDATGSTNPQSISTSPNLPQYIWDFGDGSTACGGICAGLNADTKTHSYASTGTYTVTVTVTDGNCSEVASITFNVNEEPTGSVVASNMNCNGVCDGSLDLTVTNGSAPYSYSWDNGAGTSEDPNSLCVNTYNVTITDANGCTTTAAGTITEPTALMASATGNNVSCNGFADGALTATSSGGTSPYTYDIGNGPQSSGSFTGLTAGNYSIAITDDNNCSTIVPFTISEPIVLAGSIALQTGVTCNGGSDGSTDLTTTGGTGPLTYLWDNGAASTSEDIAGLTVGTYNVTVTDANGCTATDQLILSEPTLIVLTPAFVASTCGQANGEVSLTVAGGTAGYAYLWDDGAASTTASVNGLGAGTYNVIVTDAQGCTQTTPSTITDGAAGTATTAIDNNVSCFGVCDGGATVTVVGGTGPFTYLWNNGETTLVATALCAGTNSVDVTDANGCVISVTANITEPAVLTAAITGSTDPLCASVCDGTADVTAAGGTTTYTYSWTSGGASAGETAMCAGTETVTITDANGCTATADVTLMDPALLTTAVVGTDPLCNAGTDGSTDLTTTGGTGPLTYLWDNGAASTSEDVAGLTVGTYNVTVTDANGCNATDQVILSEPVAVSFTPIPIDATCSSANGQIDIAATGGDGNYLYSNDNGATSQGGSSFTGLFAGNYDVIVTDGNGCANTVVVAISNLGAPAIDSIIITNPLCPGVCDGTINIFASGGGGGYQYSVDNGTTFQTASAFNGQCSGIYNLIVEDANLCQVAGSTSLTDPAVMSYTATITNLDCFGACIGVIDISGVAGGDGNYTYSNNNGAITQPTGTFNTLCAGPYDIIVEDGNGCQTASIETVTEPTIVNFTFTTADNTCNQLNAGCDGQMTLTGIGGTGAYTFSIDNGVTFVSANVFTGLCAGTYDVVVMDVNNCSATQTVTILEPMFLDFTSTTILTSCGAANGEITLSGQGGTGVYEYSIDNGASYQTAANFTGIIAGAYDCCVRDASGCTFCTVVSVNNNSGQTISNIALTEPTCNASCDGIITTTITGGSAPIMYSLDGGALQVSNIFTGVCAGVHTINTQDNNGCQAGGNVTLTDPEIMEYVPVITDLDCFEQCIGLIDFTASSGGNGVYQYSIDGGVTFQPGATFTNLCAGTYDLVIEDGNLCSATSTETISEPTQMSIIFNTIDVTCTGFCDGSASAAISGGVTPYDYQWSGGIAGNTDTDALSLCANNYDLIVLDANGCQIDSIQFVIGEPSSFVVNAVTATDELCNADCQGAINIDAPGAVSFSIDNNATNQPGQLFAGLCEGNYDTYVSNAAGCIATTASVVGTPTLLTLTQGLDTLICISGTADICGYASGGTLPYTYSWDIPATGQCQSVSPTTDSSYEVYIEDANGCVAPPRTITVFVNPILQAFAYQDEVICPGDTAQIEASAVGGNGGPYTYSWINDQNGTVLVGELFLVNPPVTTTYTAIVTDNCGTPADSSSVTITVLPLPELEWLVDQQTGCDPLEVNFTNLTNGTLLGNCQWDFGDGTTSSNWDPTHVFSPGCYDVTFTVFSPEGCKSDTILVSYICVSEIPIPEFDFGPQPTTILSSAISFTNTSAGAVTYFWDFGFDNETSMEADPQNIAFPNVDPGTYNVCLTATSSAGCDSTVCYDVIINDEFLFYIPNSFTPNGDGLNDVFLPKVRGHDPLRYELLIFNRWGELIFTSSFPNIGWDGFYRGTLSQTDAYVWKIRVKDQVNGEQKEYIGHVTLLR